MIRTLVLSVSALLFSLGPQGDLSMKPDISDQYDQPAPTTRDDGGWILTVIDDKGVSESFFEDYIGCLLSRAAAESDALVVVADCQPKKNLR